MLGNYYGNMLDCGFGGGIVMIIFWVAVTFFIIWLVKEAKGGNNPDSSISKPAIDILKERYAKGEIDKKEFEEKKKDLTN